MEDEEDTATEKDRGQSPSLHKVPLLSEFEIGPK